MLARLDLSKVRAGDKADVWNRKYVTSALEQLLSWPRIGRLMESTTHKRKHFLAELKITSRPAGRRSLEQAAAGDPSSALGWARIHNQ